MKKNVNIFTLLYRHGFALFFAFSLLIFSACNSDQKQAKNTKFNAPASNNEYFQVITQEIGIDFKHSIGDEHLSNLVESVGGGAAFLDFDQDGFLDIYICNGAHVKGLSEGDKPKEKLQNQLFRNMQNGTYQNVTGNSGVGDLGYGMGMTIGDFDNNGYPDIYISNHGKNSLYKNNADGTFTDVTDKAGVGGEECSVGAVWLDFNNDGFIDLYVGNYIKFDPEYGYFYAPDGFPGPMAYDAQADVLYKNNGDGTFSDVTEKMGVLNADGRAMGVGAADYDGDGFTDIFVANDHMVNYMYKNDGGEAFNDKGIMSGVAFNQSGEATISMSVDFADYNNDGLLDLFVSDDTYCSLYKNQGNGVFTDMSYPSGIAVASGQHVGWSSSFIDYDNDGDVDIFKTNGELKHLYGQEDQLFENQNGEHFADVSIERGKYFEEEHVGRGACFGDYDNDGDLDAYIVNLNDNGVLLRNNKGNTNNWILLKLVGTKSNRDGLGATVRVTTGEITQTAQKRSTTGYLSQNDPRLHFGLAQNSVIDKIEISWPSGTNQVLENIKANQVLTVSEEE